MAANNRNEQHRTLRDYTIPSTASCGSSIVHPNIEANNFELKPSLIRLVQILLDSSTGGSIQLKTPKKAMELIELVANNQYMFTSDRNMKRGVMEVDTMDAILTQLTTLNKKIEKLEVAAMGT
ncbi:hypothetical protein PIB30_094280 [Stylosanthes scabra]|uniref:Uncharacterized protein n=1 Tax=Stylosanthes scabra TaxID=79078 RepID=A0ABU6XVN5_9FABA|nr:hypothetical protein [Stylosanthes scabra]